MAKVKIDKEKLNNRKILKNRKAFHEYEILESFEAGIVLQGTEVKSIRQGRISVKPSYAAFSGTELFVYHMNIAPYDHRGYADHDPERPRKLLLHKKQLARLSGAIALKGLTLVPLSVYMTRGRVKVEVGLCRGKKLYDKRESIKKKTMERESKRELKRHM